MIIHPDFQQLDGKKSLLNNDFKNKTVIIDVTETVIQRPKKDKRNIFRKKEKTHNKNTTNNWKKLKKL